jgi:hypothetical protein
VKKDLPGMQWSNLCILPGFGNLEGFLWNYASQIPFSSFRANLFLKFPLEVSRGNFIDMLLFPMLRVRIKKIW